MLVSHAFTHFRPRTYIAPSGCFFWNSCIFGGFELQTFFFNMVAGKNPALNYDGFSKVAKNNVPHLENWIYSVDVTILETAPRLVRANLAWLLSSVAGRQRPACAVSVNSMLMWSPYR